MTIKRPDWLTLTTAQRIEAVKARAATRDVSASRIAADFTNCTRQSIIGMCFRNGIKLPNAKATPGKTAARQKPLPARTAIPRPMKPQAEPLPPPPDPLSAVLFVDAISTSTLCKWPLWDQFGPEAKCCGASRADIDSPYCAYHAGVSIGRGTDSERRADRELEKHA